VVLEARALLLLCIMNTIPTSSRSLASLSERVRGSGASPCDFQEPPPHTGGGRVMMGKSPTARRAVEELDYRRIALIRTSIKQAQVLAEATAPPPPDLFGIMCKAFWVLRVRVSSVAVDGDGGDFRAVSFVLCV
jgi:hypothetical protein